MNTKKLEALVGFLGANSQFDRRELGRRDFIRFSALFPFIASHFSCSENNSQEIDLSDDFIGESVINQSQILKVFQSEYDKKWESVLKVRSAPNITHLPYKLIYQILQLDKFPFVMLYAGGGDDIAPIIIGEMLKIPVKLIYTEIDDSVTERTRKQLDFLKSVGVLSYNCPNDRRIVDRFGLLTETIFEIKTENTVIHLVYKIRPNPDRYFTIDETAEANFFREHYMTYDEGLSKLFVKMIVDGSKKNQPIALIAPDYDGIGEAYAKITQQRPQIITKEDLINCGMSSDGYSLSNSENGNVSEAFSQVPGDVLLVRGNNACSCDICFAYSTILGREQKFSKYSILYFPENIDKIPQEDLQRRINLAFNPLKEIRGLGPTYIRNGGGLTIIN